MVKTILILLFTTITIIAKPSIGLVELNVESVNLKEEADIIFKYVQMRSESLKSDYNVIKSTMDLNELMAVTGCDEFDQPCVYEIAKSMNVDYLLYGRIEKRDDNTYKLVLSKMTVNNHGLVNVPMVGRFGKRDYMINIDSALKKMFPLVRSTSEANTLLKIRTYSKNKPILAKVYLDKKYIGKTPIVLKSDKYTVGKHTILLKSKKYDTIKQDIVLTAGETQVLSLRMYPVEIPAKKVVKKIVKKEKKAKKELVVTEDEKIWYQDWRVQVGIGVAVVTVITVTAILLLKESKPDNNVIIDLP